MLTNGNCNLELCSGRLLTRCCPHFWCPSEVALAALLLDCRRQVGAVGSFKYKHLVSVFLWVIFYSWWWGIAMGTWHLVGPKIIELFAHNSKSVKRVSMPRESQQDWARAFTIIWTRAGRKDKTGHGETAGTYVSPKYHRAWAKVNLQFSWRPGHFWRTTKMKKSIPNLAYSALQALLHTVST